MNNLIIQTDQDGQKVKAPGAGADVGTGAAEGRKRFKAAKVWVL